MRRVGFFIGLVVLQSCGGGQASFSLDPLGKTIIDESSVVLKTMPEWMSVTDEGEVAMLNGGDLCVYNSQNGKLLRSFGHHSINGDSLVRRSLSPTHLDSIIILPPDTNARPEETSRVISFHYSGGEYVIYYYVSYEYRYKDKERSRQNAMSGMNEDMKKQISAMAEPAIFTVSDLAPFFIVTDKNFSVKRILPVDYASFPRTPHGQYRPFPETGFYRRGENLYMKAYDQASALMLTPDQRIKQSDSLPMMAELEMQNGEVKWKRELLNTWSVPNYKHTSEEYGFTYRYYQVINDTLVVLNEAGMFSLPQGKKYRLQPPLDEHKIARGNFEALDGKLIYCCGPKRADGRLNYDSLRLRIFSCGTQAAEYEMPVKGAEFARHKDTLLLIGKDKEHYYIERYAIVKK